MSRSQPQLFKAITILLLFASLSPAILAEQLLWPYNLPSDANYSPEDEPIMRKRELAQERLQNERVVGVKKMSLDEGEMFFPEYWTFESDVAPNGALIRRRHWDDGFDALDEYSNTSTPQTLWPVFALHTDEQISQNPLSRRFFPEHFRRQLEKRFQCPSGTSACTSIDRPNVCCATDETCVLASNTGLGDAGCCPDGETCGNTVSSCQSGYTSCPNNPGGGCCIPGSACLDTGCVITSTETVTGSSTIEASSSTSTQVSSSTLPLVTITSTTTIVVYPSTTVVTSSSSSKSSTSSSTSTTSKSSGTQSVVVTTTVTSSSSSALTCSSNYRSCPASLGGGCCPKDSACGSPTCPPSSSTSTSTASLIPPVRGTTEKSTTKSTSSSSSSSVTDSSCPTGYYACSAYYQGGCCQVGRDCSKTSCPAASSTSLIETNSVTIVAPATSGVSATIEGETGHCATGWALSPTSAGGGCCPSGYACGSSCTVATAATQTAYGSLVSKEQPSNSAGCRVFDGSIVMSIFTITCFMICFMIR